MNKKAQDALQISTGQALKLVIGGLLLIFLVLILYSLHAGLNKSQPVDNAEKDFDRVVAEIKDIVPGESITVPILSEFHNIAVIPSERAAEAGLSCPGEGNYCACLKTPEDGIKKCSTFELPDAVIRFDSEINEAEMNRNIGILLTFEVKNREKILTIS